MTHRGHQGLRQKGVDHRAIAARKAVMAEAMQGNALSRLDLLEDRMRAILADETVLPRVVIRYRDRAPAPPSRIQPALMVPEVIGLTAVDARAMLVDARGRAL